MGWTGGCLCGEIRYETSAAPSWVCHCHCSMCRRQRGAALSTFVCFPAGTVRWPKRYRSSEDAERSFCPNCGSTVGIHRSHETHLGIGIFDQPDSVVGDESNCLHVLYQNHIRWFDTADNWPRFDKFGTGKEEELEQLRGPAHQRIEAWCKSLPAQLPQSILTYDRP